ncbi:MAG: c-type cytochrome [Kofleriaceae bacterium]
MPLLTIAIAAIGWRSTASTAPPARPPNTLPGWPVYDRYCGPCHGAAGDGSGPAAPYTTPRPRAFDRGDLAWRSTPLGQPPTDDDLRVTIRHGAPGTSMPGFGAILDDATIDQLIAVVKAFAPHGYRARAAPVVLGEPPALAASRGAVLWTRFGCAACHDRGATEPRAPDLRQTPLHRPRSDDQPTTKRRAAALTIATGLAGTTMPGYSGTLTTAEIWALADHVLALGASAERADATTLDLGAIAADRRAPIDVGTWPGRGGDGGAVFGRALQPQGPPPTALPRDQASLDARRCGECHTKQLERWSGSIHNMASSPGFRAQIAGMTAAETASCQRCHAPLAEQRTDAALRDQGVQCAGCHVRSWVRHGPERSAGSLPPLAGYPRSTLSIYERGDFCLPCHQLPPRSAVAGKPLLNTYKEWLEGPYMRRGVQCQHCHMPERDHRIRGIHDPAMVRRAFSLAARAHRSGSQITAAAELANVGAGHYLPTTPTPAIWLSIELIDRNGTTIPGASAMLRIGRDIAYDATRGWQERSDTRIPPGERRVVARAWSGGRTLEASAARITVEVHPDAYYEHLYTVRLAGTLPAAQRALYEAALARASASHYVADRRLVPIAPPGS